MKKNNVVWLTGLSGSGKTTLSNLIAKKLKNKKFKVIIIDGDSFRVKKDYKKNFSKVKIYENNILIIRYIYKLYKNYDYVIVSVISPLKKTRLIAKKKFKEKYYEVFVNCSIKELVKRDTKDLYARAKSGKLKNLIGFNSKIVYEKSDYKKIIVNTHKEKLNESLKKILKKII